MYVKDISSKIRRTLVYKREQGQFIGSFAPYGYMIDHEDKHHLVIDEETASVVRQIFDMYVSGEGYRRIVQKLNADGIRMFISEFTDYMTVSKWARESMAFCFKAGILVSDEFEEDILPGQAITRGEVALMVYRLLLKAALL